MAGVRKFISFVFAVCLVITSLAIPPSLAQEAVTNDQLYAMLGSQAHNLMRDQRERLVQILEGFLNGDWTSIRRALRRIDRDIQKIASQYKPIPGKEDDRMIAIIAIKQHAAMLDFEARRENFAAAFSYFNAMTQECIACHQAQRQWGVFETEDAGDEDLDAAAVAEGAAEINVSYE